MLATALDAACSGERWKALREEAGSEPHGLHWGMARLEPFTGKLQHKDGLALSILPNHASDSLCMAGPCWTHLRRVCGKDAVPSLPPSRLSAEALLEPSG